MTTARVARAQRRRHFSQSQPGSSQISARSLHAFHSMTIACLTLAMATGGLRRLPVPPGQGLGWSRADAAWTEPGTEVRVELF